MATTWQRAIERHLRTYAHLYVFTTVLFFVGILFGSVIVSVLANGERHSLYDLLQKFVDAFNGHRTASPGLVVWSRALDNLKLVGILWLLGVSMIGLPLIVIVVFLKGFVVGFTVGFLVQQWAAKGLLFSIAAILPQNVLIVPAFIVAGATGIAFSLGLVQNRFGQRMGTMSTNFRNYAGLTLAVSLVVIAAAFIEGYISPVVMGWITPHLS